MSDGEFYFSVGYRIPPARNRDPVPYCTTFATQFLLREVWKAPPFLERHARLRLRAYAAPSGPRCEKYIVCLRKMPRKACGRGHRQNAEPLLRALPSAGLRLVQAPPDSFDAGQLLPLSVWSIALLERPAAVPGPARPPGAGGHVADVRRRSGPSPAASKPPAPGGGKFLAISRSKAMADRISLSGLRAGATWPWSAAASGAANVLVQLPRTAGQRCASTPATAWTCWPTPAWPAGAEFTQPDHPLQLST